jgi:uncharacterized protein YjeT (DUF2065 family)
MFLVISALVLMVIPRRWHAGYAVFWARKIPTSMMRIIGLISIFMGLLVWSVTY